MEKEYVLQKLIEFFLEDFENDPAGVGDWLAQDEIDANEFITTVRAFARNRGR